jgi:hypothetical protein
MCSGVNPLPGRFCQHCPYTWGVRDRQVLTCCLSHEMKSILMADLRSLRGLTRHSGCFYCSHTVVRLRCAILVHGRLVLTFHGGHGSPFCDLFTFLTKFILGVGRSIHISLFLLGWILLVRIVDILIARGFLSVILMAFLARPILCILRLLLFIF